MLASLRRALREQEVRICLPVFEMDEALLDASRSRFYVVNEFLHCEFFSADRTRCDFEIHFGRGEDLNRFNFYIGLGAEVISYAPIGRSEDVEDFAADVECFLRSRIRCDRRYSRDGRVVKEVYSPSLMVADGMQIMLTYNAGWGVCGRSEVIQYQPWISSGETEFVWSG